MKIKTFNKFIYVTGYITTILLFLFLVFFVYRKIHPNDRIMTYTDGPYIFYLNDTIIKSVVIEDDQAEGFKVSEKMFNLKDSNSLTNESRFLPVGFIPDEKFQCSFESHYDADKIAAVSDIHGGLNHLKALLTANNIIDQNSDWIWGNGHLVIVGDVFDKGSSVTECLWLIRKLENQAKGNGGRVHLLPGNHEVYILNGNADYTDYKYRVICDKLNTGYSNLYGRDTYLGKWLRTKNPVVEINGNLFVHGGISGEICDAKIKLTDINKYFSIRSNSDNLIQYNQNLRDTLSLLFSSAGPVEYRGYFNRNIIRRGQSGSLQDQSISSLLKNYNLQHIIVGHTIVSEIKGLFDNSIIAINTGIPEDDIPGKNTGAQMLIIEGPDYYQADMSGVRRILFSDIQFK